MNWNLFRKLFLPKKFLGIDIGTSGVKIVELGRSGKKYKLENYGSISVDIFSEKPFRIRTFEKDSILVYTQDVAREIGAILQEANIKTNQVIFSIPDFCTFFTNFELPWAKEEELEQIIQYEARRFVPLPLEEVILDWHLIKDSDFAQKKKMKILLIVIPNKIVDQYQEIANLSNLKLVSLEPEIFSLIRALIKKEEKEPIVLVDISAGSTTCSIINEGKLENSYSFDISSGRLDKLIVERYNVSYSEAERLKKRYGLLDGEMNIRQVLLPAIDTILKEIEKTFDTFYQRGGGEIQKIILNGGTALLPGLKEYFQIKLKKEVIISQPFVALDYPPVLEDTLKEIGPSYAIAIGAALRGWKY